MSKQKIFLKGLFYGFWGPLIGAIAMSVFILFEEGLDFSFFKIFIFFILFAYILAFLPAFFTGLIAGCLGEKRYILITLAGGLSSSLIGFVLNGFRFNASMLQGSLLLAAIGAISAFCLAIINYKRASREL